VGYGSASIQMAKFLAWRTAEIRIEGVGVWRLVLVHDEIASMKFNIFIYSSIFKKATGILKALLPFTPLVSVFPSMYNLNRICRYMDNHSGQLLQFNGIM